MPFDRSDKYVKNGTSINPKIDPSSVSAPEKFKSIFENDSIDLNRLTKYQGTTNEGYYKKFKPSINFSPVKGQKSINEKMVNVLNKIGVFGLDKNTPLSHTASNGFTFKYQQQQEVRTSTVDAAVKAMNNINALQTDKKGALYVFDLETFGGTTDSNIWSPAGITEFAMQKHDFKTGQRTATNILMTNDATATELENMLTRYQKLMKEGGIEKVKEHNDVYVFASRMSLYDEKRGAKFAKVNGVYQATNLIPTEDAQPGNADSVARSVAQFRKMANELEKEKDATTGLTRDVIEYIKATGEMNVAAANDLGVVGGHNIIQFDLPVINKDIHKLYNSQLAVFNNPDATEAQLQQAMEAINLIEKSFGDNVGLNLKKGTALDTLPFTKAARDEGGFTSPNLQLGTLAETYYPKLFASGTAHLGVHDTAMNISMILDAAETGTEDKPLIKYLYDKYLSNFNTENPAIDINKNQLFIATNGIAPASTSGKGFMNYVQYHSTGDIYTGSSFKISGGKVSRTNVAGNTGFVKGGFYTVSDWNVLDLNSKNLTAEAAEQIKHLQSVYPEMNTDKVYHMAFTSHNKTRYSNPHTVHIYTSSQEEMEAIISSSMVHVADITSTGYNPVAKNGKYIMSGAVNLETGDYLSKGTLNSDAIREAIIRHETKDINNKTFEKVFTGSRSMKNIEGLLGFDAEARSKGLGKGLDLMAENNIPLTRILKSKTGKIDDIEYFNDKELKRLKKVYANHLGYKGKLDDPRALTNTSAAYEMVMGRKEYYTNLIDITRSRFRVGNKTGVTSEMNDYFVELNKRAMVESLKSKGYSKEEIKRMINNMSKYSTHESAFFSDRFDFSIGKSFDIVGKTAEKVDNMWGVKESAENVLTYNVADNNANGKFMTALYNLRMGDKAKRNIYTKQEIEKQKKEAVYKFFIDLHKNNKDVNALYSNKDFKDYLLDLNNAYEKTGTIPENFDPNEGLTLMNQAIRQAKESDMLAGIHNLTGNINILQSNQELDEHLKGITKDEIEKIASGIGGVVKYDDKTRSTRVKDLVNVFGITTHELERALEGASPEEAASKKLIAKVVNDQLYDYLDDQLQAAAFLGNTVYVDKNNRRMILGGKNNTAQALNKIPKIMVNDDGTISAMVGKENIALDLRTVYDEKTNKWHISTNLDEEFSKRKNKFLNMAKNLKSNGQEPSLTIFNDFTIDEKIRENSKITGLKTDLTTVNKRIDLSEAAKSISAIVKPGGQLNNLLDSYESIDPDMVEKLRKNPKLMAKDNTLSPQGLQALVNDLPGVVLLGLDEDSKYAKEAAEIIRMVAPTNKETQVAKGVFQIGRRPIATIANEMDNLQRPVTTGAGNVFYLNTDDITKLKDLNVLPGSILETDETMRLIEKETDNFNLVSDFRARQVYMSGQNIRMRMKSHEEVIMDADVDNITIKQATEKKKQNVYMKLTDMMASGTYEQARIGDVRVFGSVANLPIETQYLSVNKDIIGAIDETSSKEQFERLINLIGQIDRNEDGSLVYKRNRTGTIVKKGEAIAEYKAYGGIKQTFGSKFDTGVLSFSVSSDLQELTDKQITKILNEYTKEFEEYDTEKDQAQMLKQLVGILEQRNLKATYKVANVNRASLVKVLDGGAEKGETLLPQLSLGEMNEDIASYFKNLGPGFKSGTIPTDEAILALHEDIAKAEGITVNELIQRTSEKVKSERSNFNGFKNIDDVLRLVKDEREVMAVMAFGKGGAFESFASIVNDNIPKHENVGLATTAGLEEVINKIAKASGKSQDQATQEIITSMMNNDDINFMRHTVNGVYDKEKTQGFKYSINELGTIIRSGGEGETTVFDRQRLDNFFKFANDLIIKYDAEADENEKLVHENVWTQEGTEWIKHTKENPLIGNFIFEEREVNGEKRLTAVGGVNFGSHSIVKDSETESGATQQYIEASKFIQKISVKDPVLLTDQEKEDLKNAKAFVSAQKDKVSFVKIDDNTTTLLSSKRFNTAVEEELKRIGSTSEGKEKLKLLEKVTGGQVSIGEDGSISFAENIRNTGMYDGLVEEIKQYRYYNPVKEAELTDELLETEKYAHLKNTVNVIKSKGVDKVGIESAQNLYNLSKASIAAEFNNSKLFDKDKMNELINNHGFELMSIYDYIPTDGVADPAHLESIINKNILLDLGENFTDDQRYVVLPSGGQRIGEAEALAPWQGKLNNLKTQADKIKRMEAGLDIENQSELPEATKERFRKATDKMQEIRQEMIDEINKYTEKGGAFSKATTVEIPVSSNRAKLISVTSTNITNEALKDMGLGKYTVEEDSEAFMKKALVTLSDGTDVSLHDLENKGFKLDYERIGIDKFREAGFLDPETIAKYGYSTEEEMIKHLETYGVANMDIRYPLIKPESIFGTRSYLDRNFDNVNVRSVSAFSMLKVNGDSDGDSMSTFQVYLKNTNYALYDHQKREAMRELKFEGKELTPDNIMQRVLSKGTIDEQTYIDFNKFEVGMAVEALTTNPQYADKVKNDMIGDVANNIAVGKVSDVVYQLKDAKSDTFKNFKFAARSEALSGKELAANERQVKEAIGTVLNHNEALYGETIDNARKLAEGYLDISQVFDKEKYDILDTTMQGLEELKKNEAIDINAYEVMQSAIINRVRNQQLMEEGAAKAGKGVIGSVNKSLAGLRSLAGVVYKNEQSDFYNQARGNILFSAADEIEQQVISSKKVAFEVGEMRAQELGDILRSAVYNKDKAGLNEKEKLTDWLNTYMPKQSTEKIWNTIPETDRIKIENGKPYSVQQKNRYIADELISVSSEIHNTKGLRDLYTIQLNTAYKGSNAANLASNLEAPDITAKAEVYNITKQISQVELGNPIKPPKELVKPEIKRPSESNVPDLTDFVDTIQDKTEETVKDIADKVPPTDFLHQSPKLNIGTLGVAALGVAAGLMVAGYAGGGHQRPTKPQDDSQPVQVQPMLDDDNMDNGMRQQGYIINIKADTNKGARHLKKTLKDVAKASNSNGNVTINMNYKTTSGGGYSNKDIENIINNFI